MILLDKGYYDYDYVHPEPVKPITLWDDTVKSDEEVSDMLSLFGIGNKHKKPESLEDIQNHIIKQESYGS